MRVSDFIKGLSSKVADITSPLLEQVETKLGSVVEETIEKCEQGVDNRTQMYSQEYNTGVTESIADNILEQLGEVQVEEAVEATEEVTVEIAVDDLDDLF